MNIPNSYLVVMEKQVIAYGAELFKIIGAVGRAKHSRKWWCLGKI
jgi:hypothetical protein